jgi:hypothetical protein
MAYGQWHPYVEAGPIREHVQQLRASGLGIERVLVLTGIGSGTLRRLIYGDSRTGVPVERIRTTTAQLLLSLRVDATDRAPGSLHDAALTHRQLKALIDADWTVCRLAEELRRDASSLRATMRRATVRASTVVAVRDLYQRLEQAVQSQDPGLKIEGHDAPGDLGGPGEDDPMRAAPGRGLDGVSVDIDLVAVERAMRGEAVRPTAGERLEAIDRLIAQGQSLREIAVLLRTSPRTIARHRRRAA